MRVDLLSDRVAVIIPDTKISIHNSQEFKEKIIALIEEGYNDITIDMSGVSMIDSFGLGKLLLFQKKLKEQNGKLRVTNVTSESIRKMFSMINLHKVIDIN